MRYTLLFIYSYRNYNWFWVPIIGPHIGAILGAILYLLLVEVHWPSENDPEYYDHEDMDGNDGRVNSRHSSGKTGEDNGVLGEIDTIL